MRTLGASALALALAVMLTWEPPRSVAAQTSDDVDRIQKSVEILRDLTSAPDEGIPQYLLERAEAIVVIPNLVKGGFVVGGKHGKGIVSIRDRARNSWSAPVFLKMTGGSIGWQIGVESTDLVLLVMNRKGVEDLLDDKFTLGGNLSVAAGPVGRSADAATNIKISSQVLAYSRSKGLFVGASLEGSALHGDDDSNKAFYSKEISLRSIVTGHHLTPKYPEAVTTWVTTLKNLTSSK
jgi:lipid-binding SYLF domain-containing protein